MPSGRIVRHDVGMRAIRERLLPPWVVGLAVFLVVAVLAQLLLSGGALLLAIPPGVIAGAVYARRQAAVSDAQPVRWLLAASATRLLVKVAIWRQKMDPLPVAVLPDLADQLGSG